MKAELGRAARRMASNRWLLMTVNSVVDPSFLVRQLIGRPGKHEFGPGTRLRELLSAGISRRIAGAATTSPRVGKCLVVRLDVVELVEVVDHQPVGLAAWPVRTGRLGN